MKHIKVCATKLLHVFVLLIFEDNPFAVPDSSLINDKLHQYFVDSLYNLCDLIIAVIAFYFLVIFWIKKKIFRLKKFLDVCRGDWLTSDSVNVVFGKTLVS